MDAVVTRTGIPCGRRVVLAAILALAAASGLATKSTISKKRKKKKKKKNGGSAPDTRQLLTLHDIFYDPKAVIIAASQNVPLLLRNQGATTHTFVIDALAINTQVAPGASTEVVVNAPPGDYEFYCIIPGHRAAGMTGTLSAR